jgi:hypothetical protein
MSLIVLGRQYALFDADSEEETKKGDSWAPFTLVPLQIRAPLLS